MKLWAKPSLSVSALSLLGVGLLNGQGTPCQRPAIAPTSSTLNANNWSLAYNVSADDGLEVIDVKMNTRPIHQRINLPYFNLATSGMNATRCELKPDGSDASCRSRLVDLQVSGANPTAFVQATYDVSDIPAGSNSCLVVTQRYEFWATGSTPQCNPTITELCAPYFPIVSYQYLPGTATLTSINTVQRLELRIGEEGTTPNADQAALIGSDCDGEPGSGTQPACSFRPPFVTILANNDNPLRDEFAGTAIVNGQKGDWDNFHQTYNRRINIGAMCLECQHMHWRYSNAYGGHWNLGAPLIPPGSNQWASFAVVRARAGEEDPSNYATLANGESLRGQAPVFFYSATGFLNADSFFVHGGYVYPNGI